MNSPQEEPLPKARADVIFRALDANWVLFDPTTNELHVLNLSAAMVWSHLDGETPVEGVASAIASSFSPPLSAPDAITDVQDVLAVFRDAGLLEVSSTE